MIRQYREQKYIISAGHADSASQQFKKKEITRRNVDVSLINFGLCSKFLYQYVDICSWINFCDWHSERAVTGLSLSEIREFGWSGIVRKIS